MKGFEIAKTSLYAELVEGIAVIVNVCNQLYYRVSVYVSKAGVHTHGLVSALVMND